MFHARGLAVVLCLGLAMPALAFVSKETSSRDALKIERSRVRLAGRTLDTASATALGNAARSFESRYGGQWSFAADARTTRIAGIHGSGIPLLPGRGNRLGTETLDGLNLPDGRVTIQAVEPLIRSFIDANRELIAPARGTLVLNESSSQLREDGRLISFYYDWLVDGIPVEQARVFVRLNAGNITWLGAPLVGTIDLDTSPVVDADEATRRLVGYTGDGEVARLRGEPQLVIQPENGSGERIAYRLVWKITYRILGEIETWEGRVDALTGEIVAFEDTNLYARAVGGVYPRTVFEDNETIAAMGQVDVTTDGGVLTADDSGSYGYSGGPFSSGLNGRYFDTSCQGCSDPVQPQVLGELGSGRIDYGFGGEDEVGNGFSTPADRNTFFHLNQVRRIGKKWLPNFGSYLDYLHYPANVNIANSCNAVYTGFEVNFYRAGGNCNNTGEIADVIYHEYGHGMDSQSNSGDGATGEATADVVSMQLTRSPLVGPGFNVSGAPVRNLDKDTTPKGLLTRGNVLSKCGCGPTQSCGPLGAEVHCEGEIYGQTAWDLSQALAAKHGQHTGWRTSEQIFFTSLPDASSYLHDGTDPVYTAYINADDDDGNLINGTPNAQEIFDAFDLHEIAGTQYPTSTPCTRPAQPSVSVVASCDRFDLSWTAVPGAASYEIFRMEMLEDMAHFPVAEIAPPTTAYVDTEVSPGVDYWYVVMAVDGSGCESTVENPEPATLPAQPILDVTAAVNDDEPRGNRSGFADPGEEVDLFVTLRNVGEVGASSVSGTIISTTPGVTMLFDNSTWSDLAVGGSAASQNELRFQTDDQVASCGDTLRFELDPDEASGCAADTSYFDVRLGEPFVDFSNDFETDQGWQADAVNSTAATGAWIRGVPEPTEYQTGVDVTENGSQCWFTGSNAGGSAGQDDVDDGVAILVSSAYDLTGLAGAEVSYYRWYAMSEPGTDAGDFFSVDVSDDDGQSWVNLETLDNNQPAPSWIRRSFRLEDFISLTDQVRFRFQAADGLADGSIIEAAVDELRIERFVCDDTPACFDEPTFSGLETAVAGSSCGEVDLAWQPAVSNCIDAAVTYNVYRSSFPGFTPGPANLIYEGLTSESITDPLLDPGETYYYIVRADDSRSGEDANTVELSAVPPTGPDTAAPIFDGVQSVVSGAVCGETQLSWSAALESCSGPVAYDIYRSTDPGFVPGPADLIGSTFGTTFVDAGISVGSDFTYVVRARDTQGNAESNLTRVSGQSAILDLIAAETDFEPDDNLWTVTDPNDAATGEWAWGDPSGTAYQSEDDATPGGVNAWITGLGTTPSNGDIDDGTTTLLTRRYILTGAVAPVVRYARWFTNNLGGSPNDATDSFRVELTSNDGSSWVDLDANGPGVPGTEKLCPASDPCPLEWTTVEHTLPGPYTNQMRLRFTAADLGAGSLVEAGVDDFSLVDPDQGCNSCLPVLTVCDISIEISGDDIVVSWQGLPGKRVTVYEVSGCGEALKLGTTQTTSFVHEGAVLSPEAFNYRVTVVDDCGNETPLGSCFPLDCP